MRLRRTATIAAALSASVLLTSCAGQGTEDSPSSAQQPFRAEFNADGFATILDVPPAAFDPQQPAPPQPRTSEQVAADAEFMRVTGYQNSVMDEVQALNERLRLEEKGNFVDLYYDNDGELGVVFQFLRDGRKTLSRYSRNPTFRGETVRWSQDELRAAAEFMWDTFRDERVIQGTGIRPQEVNVEIIVSEQEFRELVRRKGVTIPQQVTLVFRDGPMVPISNPPRPAIHDDAVPAAVAERLRIFPRHDRPAGALNAINSRVKLVLRDGCFRASDRDDALVLFPFGARLFVDTDNYLAFGSGETPGYARVGETVTFMGSINEVSVPELVEPIHAACGPGKVIKVEGLKSASAQGRQDAAMDTANALRRLQNEYGLGQSQARRAIAWLDRKQMANRQVDGKGIALPPMTASMVIDSPPRPVLDEADCPAGTSFVSFICRTPEGYLRPLPAWLVEFLEQD